jgi:pyrroloquinoline quinone biosynthesis protein B
MRILVLGSAAGGGFPQWNCNCDNCRRARRGDPSARPRTQSSLAVSADGQQWLLLNASPDLRQQIADNPALHPQGGKRHSPIAAAVLTNGDVDHIAGLLSLRESQPLAIYASERIHEVLRGNSIFNVLNTELVARRVMPLAEPVAIETAASQRLGLSVEAFAVPGKTALYLEDAAAGPGLGTQLGDTIGLKITATQGGAAFYYVPGCAALSPALAQRLKNAALVFFDGTLWRDDEMIVAGVGSKTGRRMGHMSLSGPDGSIAALGDLGIARRIFIHINNTNPVLIEDSAERRTAEAAGWEIAFDGMEIAL